MVSEREETAHQRVGTVSSVSGVAGIHTYYQKQNCASEYGQHHSSVISDETRRDTLPQVDENHMSDFQSFGQSGCSVSVPAHSREAECARGQDIEERTNFKHRVVHSSFDHKSDMGSLGKTSDRSVCNKVKQQTPNIHISSTRQDSMGSGCTVNQLEQHVRIRVPSDGNLGKSAQQDSYGKLPGHSDSTKMGRSELVSSVTRSASRRTKKDSGMAQTSETTSIVNVSSETRSVRSSCVDVIKRCFEERGFSKKTAERMAQPQKASSLEVYEAKWRVFCNWCSSQQVDPCSASIVKVADFFTYLHEERNCTTSTIEGYRTAIGHVLRIKSGLNISQDDAISRLLANFKRSANRPANIMPKWNLAAVLELLSDTPFEPIQSIDLKFLTFKTVFLITLASGKRRSEVHAFTYKGFSRDPKWKHVTLRTDPSFVSKTDLAGNRRRVLTPVTIPAISTADGYSKKDDHKLCPVRSLKYYLRKTEDLRFGKKGLFVSYKTGHSKDIAKNTISFWLRKTISCAYSSASEEHLKKFQIRPHEIRALASSWAFLKNIAMEEVMESCSWRSKNTFIRHYLRDMTEVGDQLQRLGPLIVAQKQV